MTKQEKINSAVVASMFGLAMCYLGTLYCTVSALANVTIQPRSINPPVYRPLPNILLHPQIIPVVKKKVDKKQINCMAKNIFFEAGNQSLLGMRAVAYVTLNRTHHRHFPRTACSVVNQVNQFSWKDEDHNRPHGWNWHRAEKVAFSVYTSYNPAHDPTHGALYYHATYVEPNWRHCKETVRIGQHRFYKGMCLEE